MRFEEQKRLKGEKAQVRRMVNMKEPDRMT